MKVAHLSSAHPAFDIRIFQKECRALAQAGHDVTFVVPHDEDAVVDEVRILAVPRPTSRKARMTRTVSDVMRAALALQADAYHLHDPELLFAAPLLKASGARVVYDVHEDLPGQIVSKHWIPTWLRAPMSGVAATVEFLLARSVLDRIVAATPAIASRFPMQKTHVVQNFPILGELAATNSEPHANRPREAAYVGGITVARGLIEMVEAMTHLSDLGARLRLAGHFAPKTLGNRARALPGWASVDFLGQQSRTEIAALLGRSRVGLVLFHPEPNHVRAQPNKLFEYMSAGLPVIASDFPLWREIVVGSQCGLVVDPRDPRAIAAGIRTVLLDPELGEEMAHAGQQAIEKKYNWAVEARVLVSAYEAMAG